jgi:hypothetical protein
MHLRAIIFVAILSLVGLATGAEPRPIFSDDDSASSHDFRRVKPGPRPVFTDAPFFEEDVWVDTTKRSILPVECQTDGLFGPTEKFFGEFGPSYADRDRWAWPDRGRVWTARAGIVVMNRSGATGDTLINNPANPAQSLDARDFGFTFEDGFEFDFIAHDLIPFPSEGYDFQFRLLNLDMEEAGQFGSFTGAQSQIFSTPPTLATGTHDIFANYTTELRTYEMNLRREADCGWLTWIGGLRYVNFDENLHMQLIDRPGVNPDVDYNINTVNQMLGLQMGGQLAFVRNERWCVDVTGKFGVYANRASHTGELSGVVGTTSVNTDTIQTAYMMEIDFMTRRVLTEHWSAYLGYDVMWMEGIAPASAQVAATDFNNGRGIDTDHSVLFHGFQLGLEFRY